MSTWSYWHPLSGVELRRIFDVCKRWANSGLARIRKDKYGSIHETAQAIRSLLEWKFSAPTARFGLFYRSILFLLCVNKTFNAYKDFSLEEEIDCVCVCRVQEKREKLCLVGVAARIIICNQHSNSVVSTSSKEF